MEKIKPVLLFIRKNFLSLLSAIVVIASLAILYGPISDWYTQLQTTVDARKSVFATLNSLLTKPRTLPILNPQDTQAAALGQFPTEGTIKRGAVVIKELTDQSARIMDSARSAVTHQPLVPGALPNGGTMESTIFREQYQKIMPNPTMVADQLKQTLPVTLLSGGQPPSAAEITAAQNAEKTQIIQEKTQYGTDGKAVNADAVNALVADALIAKPDEMRAAVAMNSKMYVASDVIHLNPGITGIAPPSTIVMFNAQMSMWLIQDVFNALNACNATPLAMPATMPTTAPSGDPAAATQGIPVSRIKHLLKFDYSDTPLTSGAVSSDPNAAAAAAADPLHPTSNMLASPTGHVSNGLYDVVPFQLKIIVDEASVPDVLTTLSQNRFITVLKMDVLSVDSGESLIGGFIYGTQPVVQLNLSCEELFFRQDIVPFMPDPIKRALGVPTAAPAS